MVSVLAVISIKKRVLDPKAMIVSLLPLLNTNME
jgi:hypothetical protein